jgi:uncharacterized metal-binding protein YceD (DUF177 family)
MGRLDQSDRPWTVPVTVADIPEAGGHYELSADAVARDAVARLAGLRTLPKFDAVFDLIRRGEGVAVRGDVKARVGQTCVVTLDPIENEVRETVDLVFAPAVGFDDAPTGTKRAKKRREPAEPLENGIIDLGAVAIEFLILGLDPYPRKPGAKFARDGDEAGGANPFAALAMLKRGRSRT